MGFGLRGVSASSALSGIPGSTPHVARRAGDARPSRRLHDVVARVGVGAPRVLAPRGGASVRSGAARRSASAARRAPAPRAALEEGPVARRADADDDDAPSRPGALSVVDSTDDVFAEFCASQVEHVARALGRGV